MGAIERTEEEKEAQREEQEKWDKEHGKKLTLINEDEKKRKYIRLREDIKTSLTSLSQYREPSDELKIVMLKALLVNIFTGPQFMFALKLFKDDSNYEDVYDLATNANQLYLEKQKKRNENNNETRDKDITAIDNQINQIKRDAMLKLQAITNTSSQNNENELEVFLKSLPEDSEYQRNLNLLIKD